MPEIQHVALVREPGRHSTVELTHLARVPIDVARRAPNRELRCRPGGAGRGDRMAAAARSPADSPFVEDTAVIFPESPFSPAGVSSRQTEVASVAPALADTGSCGRSGRGILDVATAASRTRVLVGLSSATNAAGAAARATRSPNSAMTSRGPRPRRAASQERLYGNRR